MSQLAFTGISGDPLLQSLGQTMGLTRAVDGKRIVFEGIEFRYDAEPSSLGEGGQNRRQARQTGKACEARDADHWRNQYKAIRSDSFSSPIYRGIHQGQRRRWRSRPDAAARTDRCACVPRAPRAASPPSSLPTRHLSGPRAQCHAPAASARSPQTRGHDRNARCDADYTENPTPMQKRDGADRFALRLEHE